MVENYSKLCSCSLLLHTCPQSYKILFQNKHKYFEIWCLLSYTHILVMCGCVYVLIRLSQLGCKFNKHGLKLGRKNQDNFKFAHIYQQKFSFFFFFFLSFCYWAAPSAYGGSRARGLIGAVATGLHQSHSNVGSEPRL